MKKGWDTPTFFFWKMQRLRENSKMEHTPGEHYNYAKNWNPSYS
jgi:hypothetical protein